MNSQIKILQAMTLMAETLDSESSYRERLILEIRRALTLETSHGMLD